MLNFKIPIIHYNEDLTINQIISSYDCEDSLYIVTDTYYDRIYGQLSSSKIVRSLSNNKNDLDNYRESVPDVKTIIGIGGGRILDQAKYLASLIPCQLILIPSVLSTNAFSTDRSVLIINNQQTSVISRIADIVIVPSDNDRLSDESLIDNYGYLDVLSIYTALNDWRLAIKAGKALYSCELTIAEGILLSFLNNDLDTLNKIKLILMSGLIVNLYGDGRPESGSEHIIAKAIESHIQCAHAHSVSLGILAVMKLQNTWNDQIASLCLTLPNWKSQKNLSILSKINVENLIMSIKPRNERFTIIDIVSETETIDALNFALNYIKNGIH